MIVSMSASILQTESVHPRLPVSVLMQRRRHASAWQEWSFSVMQVLPAHADTPLVEAPTEVQRHDGLEAALFRDEAEGYYLNLSSGAPVWFVMWRQDDIDPSRAWPEMVTLSYHEAARWLDAQERVDNVPLDDAVAHWLAQFTEAHYQPEPKQRRRPASFKAPSHR